MDKILEKYEPVIGMEVHAELKTKAKMFCGCLNNPDEEKPNVNVCPVCLGHPGALPVPNRKAVEKIIQIGFALKAKIPEVAVFSRKNYFYPDLPKGYQITSQPDPFAIGGELKMGEGGERVVIDHIHLEEDTGTLQHGNGFSLVNFNRSGTPLMELVTEPGIRSGREARKFCEELQLLLRYLKASDANMEKGEMRCEVNISLRIRGVSEFGTKVEIKNLNSFRAVERAVEFEIKRQAKILDDGEKVKQETRGWDDLKQATVSQRQKEEAHDYRYFPEPDLPIYRTADFDLKKIEMEVPELPIEKRKRFKEEYGLSGEQVEVLVFDQDLADFFEKAASEMPLENRSVKNQTLYNYLVTDLRGMMKGKNMPFEELKITPENFVDLVAMVEKGEIGSRVAKDVLLKMFEEGSDPGVIIKEEGLEQVSDEGDLLETVKQVIGEQEKVVDDYKKGKGSAVMFLVGQAMKKLRGKGNPQILKDLFEKEIGKIMNN